MTPTYVLRGTLSWAKLIGKPRLNTYSGENEWSVDFTPDSASREKLGKMGIAEKLREPKDTDTRTETFLSFRQRESREDKDGVRHLNKPITLLTPDNKLWPENTLIGNGSIADIKFTVKDNGKGRPKGVYLQALRVLEHVPYVIEEFAPLSTDDEYFSGEPASSDDAAAPEADAKGKTVNPDDLDDDIPFDKGN